MTHLCEAALAEAVEWWATLSENEKEGRREHAAKIVNLPELLESSRLWHRCLFQGKAYDELRTVAPWLVRPERENAFTRTLFSRL